MKTLPTALTAVLIAAGGLSASYLFFKPEEFVWQILVACIVVLGVFFLSFLKNKKIQNAGKISTAILLALVGTYLFLNILSCAFPAYRIWIDLFVQGWRGGSLGSLFFACSGYFTVIAAGSVIRSRHFGAAFGLLFFYSCLLLIFYSQFWIYLAALVFLYLWTLLITLRRITVNRKTYASLYSVVFAVTAFCSMMAGLSGSPSVDYFTKRELHPLLKRLISIPLTNVPSLTESSLTGSLDQTSSLMIPLYQSGRAVYEATYYPGALLYLREVAFQDYAHGNWEAPGETQADARPILVDGKTPAPSVTIKVLGDFLVNIPHTLNTTKISIEPAFKEQALSGSYDTMVRARYAAPRGSVIKLWLDPVFRDNNPPTETEKQAPNVFSREFETWALALPAGKTKAVEILEAFVEEVSLKFKYNTDPGIPDLESTDPIEYFALRGKTGYCKHFATLAVVYARLHHIPARYVTGYSISYARNAATMTMTTKSAHAWAEVYLEDRGWVIFETTPPNLPQEYLVAKNYKVPPQKNGDKAAEGGGQNASTTGPELFRGWTWALLGIFLVLVILVMVLAQKRKLRWWPGKKPLQLAALRLVASAGSRDVVAQKGWEAWLADVLKRHGKHRIILSRSVKLIQRGLYSSIGFSHRDLAYLKKCRQRLRQNGKKKNLLSYFVD